MPTKVYDLNHLQSQFFKMKQGKHHYDLFLRNVDMAIEFHRRIMNNKKNSPERREQAKQDLQFCVDLRKQAKQWLLNEIEKHRAIIHQIVVDDTLFKKFNSQNRRYNEKEIRSFQIHCASLIDKLKFAIKIMCYDDALFLYRQLKRRRCQIPTSIENFITFKFYREVLTDADKLILSQLEKRLRG